MSNENPRQALARLLDQTRFEVLPTPTIGDKVRAAVPRSQTVTVTASPSKPLSVTLDLACALADDGYDTVPHIAARMVTGRSELAEIADRCRQHNITKVFVPAGDAETPAGPYAASVDLLADLADIAHPFTQIGVTGYPESHPTIDDDVTVQAMWDKRHYATTVISNMTFDARLVDSWVGRMRRRGIEMPVLVGVPGPVETAKLITMAGRIGVGDSVRFLQKQKGVFARLLTPGFTTDKFVQRVARSAADPRNRIDGIHLFTFNQVEVCEAWRQEMLASTAR